LEREAAALVQRRIKTLAALVAVIPNTTALL
jgi:hypothetical protein